jgi:hypothetical protein
MRAGTRADVLTNIVRLNFERFEFARRRSTISRASNFHRRSRETVISNDWLKGGDILQGSHLRAGAKAEAINDYGGIGLGHTTRGYDHVEF